MRKASNLSPTYSKLLDFLFQLKVNRVQDTNQVIDGHKLLVAQCGTVSHRVIQEITIANDELWAMCKPAEWYMLGQIGRELKYGNALWSSAVMKKRSYNRTIIACLVKKGILIPTETKDIYIVNPMYIRKGDLVKVLYGTSEILMGCTEVSTDHIIPIQAIKGKNFAFDRLSR